MDTFLRPLLADGRARRRRRERPLFNSRMFDGSSLPVEENLRVSSALLEDCTAAASCSSWNAAWSGARRTP